MDEASIQVCRSDADQKGGVKGNVVVLVRDSSAPCVSEHAAEVVLSAAASTSAGVPHFKPSRKTQEKAVPKSDEGNWKAVIWLLEQGQPALLPTLHPNAIGPFLPVTGAICTAACRSRPRRRAWQEQ